MYLGHDINTIDKDPFSFRRAQRDMQHGATLGAIDLLAGEHRVDARAQATVRSKPQQEAYRLASNEVL